MKEVIKVSTNYTEADYEKELAAWEELSLEDIPVYEYDPDAAAALLNAAGWNLNASGSAFRPGTRSGPGAVRPARPGTG